MKLEHFGMAEPGDCRLVFTAGAEELAAAVAQVQAEPDAPQEEDSLLTEAVNRTILGGFSAPVSYTHLDVYKRQAMPCKPLRRQTSAPMPTPTICRTRTAAPTSTCGTG